MNCTYITYQGCPKLPRFQYSTNIGPDSILLLKPTWGTKNEKDKKKDDSKPDIQDLHHYPWFCELLTITEDTCNAETVAKVILTKLLHKIKGGK